MKIAITGTPGTGKTTISGLFEESGYEVIHITEYVQEKGLGEQKEEFEVDVHGMVDALEKEDFDVVEGHLAHHVPVDVCVVLRTRPDVLRERLEKRDYSDEKIKENIESEILDVVLSEAVQNQDTVVEIDTTDKEPEEAFNELKDKIEKGENDCGNFDWTQYL